jgi:hypothetical protein
MYGHQQELFMAIESVYGTYVHASPAAAVLANMTSIKALSCKFDPKPTYLPHDDADQQYSLMGRDEGKWSGAWSIEARLRSSGTRGTPPGLRPLLDAAFGTYTNAPGASDTWALSNLDSDLASLSMCHPFRDSAGSNWAEAVDGAWVDQLSLKVAGGDYPTISASGGFRRYWAAGYTTVVGALAGGETAIPVADCRSFMAGALVTVGTSTNGAAGHQVTAITAGVYPAGTLTVSPAIAAGAQGAGAVVRPTLYATSYANSAAPVPGTKATATIETVSFPLTAAEINVALNSEAVADECGQAYATDVMRPKKRSIAGKLEFRMRRDLNAYLGMFRTVNSNRAISLVIGDASGSIWTASIKARFDWEAANVPKDGAGMASLPFTCIGSSGSDELSLAQT